MWLPYKLNKINPTKSYTNCVGQWKVDIWQQCGIRDHGISDVDHISFTKVWFSSKKCDTVYMVGLERNLLITPLEETNSSRKCCFHLDKQRAAFRISYENKQRRIIQKLEGSTMDCLISFFFV